MIPLSENRVGISLIKYNGGVDRGDCWAMALAI